MFRQVTDLAFGGARVVEQIVAGDGHAPSRGREITADDLHGGGLARTVGAEEAEHFPLADRKADVLDRLQRAVEAREIDDFNQNRTVHFTLKFRHRACSSMGRHLREQGGECQMQCG